MTTLVAMLRGVNVGGRNRLPMEDLRRLVADLGYRAVPLTGQADPFREHGTVWLEAV